MKTVAAGVLLLIACGDPRGDAPLPPETPSSPPPEGPPPVSEPTPEPAPSPMACVPGTVISCRREGHQTCLPDGSRYGECIEPEPPTPAPVPEPVPDPPAPEPVIPELIPGAADRECTCTRVAVQEASCVEPTVNCRESGGAGRPCSEQGTEEVYWRVEAGNLELSYPPVAGSDTFPSTVDECRGVLTSEVVDSYPVEPYDLTGGCRCFIGDIDCSVTLTVDHFCT